MKVITLSQNDFNAACYTLADEIIKDCLPVAIIGVRTGGAIVADNVCLRFHDKDLDVKCLEVSASRNSSKVKRRVSVANLFNLLPMFLLNALRNFEHYCLMLTMKFDAQQERNVQLSQPLCDYLMRLNDGCVYIIDDAVDSGATIKSLLNKFKDLNPRLKYKVGVLVVTQKMPVIFPETFLYRNVLLRFPWSSDYKQ